MGVVIDRKVLLSYMEKADQKGKLKLVLINQCAPVIQRLKTANIMMVEAMSKDTIVDIAQLYGLEIHLLWQGQRKCLLFFYHEEMLEDLLQKYDIQQFLKDTGYQNGGLQEKLHILGVRIKMYYEKKSCFPHELGIFLGYPIKDVRSFMELDGDNSLYRGYWVVYHNVEEAKKTFQAYDYARAELLNRLITEI